MRLLSILPLTLSLLSLLPTTYARGQFSIPSAIDGTYTPHTPPLYPRLHPRSNGSSPLAIATSYLQSLSPSLTFTTTPDSYTSQDTATGHFFFTQTLNGLPIDNAHANVNVLRNGSILSVGSSFTNDALHPHIVKREEATVDAIDALKGVITSLNLPLAINSTKAVPRSGSDDGPTFMIEGVQGVVSEPTAQMVYYRTPEDGVKLVWRVEADMGGNWMVCYASANVVGEVMGAVDYVSDAGYGVYPIGVNDPTDGARAMLVDPHNTFASPNGWHTAGTHTYTSTRGNNGIAQENWSGGPDFINNWRPDAGENMSLKYPYATTMSEPHGYISAAVTQLFYVANAYHDLLKVLGFDEAAGNFEEVNSGSGGIGGDAVQLNAQDGSGYNNANFATPADGLRPRMRMYLWNTPSGGSTMRDGDFDNGIIIHEYTHGLSSRLTGGPSRSTCLSTMEASGMGEGWSDFFATAIRIKPGDTRATDYGLGEFPNGKGIRRYKYSTNTATNPTTYGTINLSDWSNIVHAIGSVWGNILYEILWNLEDKHGYQEAVFPTFHPGTSVPTTGRHLAMKIVLEGMKLQPCNPTFITARNAILDADRVLTGGANACELWMGFAKRGLGTRAAQGNRPNARIEDFTFPAACAR